MAATATKPKPKRKTSTKRSPGTVDSNELKRRLDASVDRIEKSIDAAEAAAKDLRAGAAKGSRDLVRDLERALRNAKANARRAGRAVSKDIDKAMRTGTRSRSQA
jgi:hypothetical protein